ncbi:MAG TPA: DNA polymerase III subunit delta [Phycisphaerales bacterium]|nr:DNA polymerase III subunit delta [Phycisphaerales bacterium]
MAAERKKFQSVTIDATMRIVALVGEDAYLLGYHSRKLAELLRAKYGEIQEFHFDGTSASLAEVLDELRSLSLMQTHKLVTVDSADVFLKAGGDEEEESEPSGKGGASKRAALERYAASPVEDATLLLRASTWRPGNLDKLIAKVGMVIKLQSPDDAGAIVWCVERCKKQYGVEIDRAAAEKLVRLIGPELAMLDTELGKLANFAGGTGAKKIETGHVDQMVGMSREDQAWAIQSAVLSGDSKRAVEKLRELLTVSRVDIVPLTWSIMDLLRKVHAAGRLQQEGMNPGMIAKELKLWGDAVQGVLNAGKRVKPETSAQLLRAAVETDQHNKSGVGEPERNLEVLTQRVADTIGNAR